ncbi:hypothetical protein [Ferruginibacter sp. SUN106]|uniref:hypothetical protein n=1 Tax=Ferruginibacter sp. SUN106 TaxID=2978348 RepID=UPI003D35E2F9
MVQKFEIIKIVKHHNRGQFIFARHNDTTQCIIVKEGSIFGGIPVYHYTDIEVDAGIYTFRPLNLAGFPDNHFQAGQVTDLLLND